MITYFERFTIEMSFEQAKNASHQGECINEVKELLSDSTIQAQLDQIPPQDIREELEEYGAWDDEELADNEANRERIIWLAACDISEECAVFKAYDNGGKTADRYTVLIGSDIYFMSENANMPNGVCIYAGQLDYDIPRSAFEGDSELGKEIPVSELPDSVMKQINGNL